MPSTLWWRFVGIGLDLPSLRSGWDRFWPWRSGAGLLCPHRWAVTDFFPPLARLAGSLAVPDLSFSRISENRLSACFQQSMAGTSCVSSLIKAGGGGGAGPFVSIQGNSIPLANGNDVRCPWALQSLAEWVIIACVPPPPPSDIWDETQPVPTESCWKQKCGKETEEPERGEANHQSKGCAHLHL